MPQVDFQKSSVKNSGKVPTLKLAKSWLSKIFCEKLWKSANPKICKKLYFHASDNLVFEQVSKLKLNNLIILDSTSVDNICRYMRVYSHNNYISLVPVLSGPIDKKVWAKYSKDILARYLAAT